MRILYLAPFIPYPLNRGTHQRVFHLLSSLAQAHRVTLLVLDPDGVGAAHEDVMAALCEAVLRIPVQLQPWRSLGQRLLSPQPETMRHWDLPEVRRALAALLQRESFDLIFCEDICMTQYLLTLNPEIPVITDRNRVDLEFMHEQAPYIHGLKAQAAFRENLLKLERFERRLLARFPDQVVCSPEDADFMTRRLGVTPQIIGNGVDPAYFSPQPWQHDPEAPMLCFSGTMDYGPNIDGISWFVESVWPLIRQQQPTCRLRVVGLNPTPEVKALGRLPGIEVTGGVPDMRPYYAACDVYLAPIRIGGGTRLKILEALAMGKAVVSTTTGAQGLFLQDGEQVCFADSASAFAQAVCALLAAPQRAAALAQAGRHHVLERFSWPQLGRELNRYVSERVQAAPISAAMRSR
ncbi:MAG: glycosyltransferase [Candidatus Sericytochromatia bacterium]